jgi:histidyl-tRNA synthetase
LDEINNKFKFSSNYLVVDGLSEINELEKYIIGMGIDKYCCFDSSLARGQDYYTGNVFEVYEKNGLLTSSIGGGGRYDKMIGEFIDDGEVYPAVGVSFGLTSLFELLKDREEFSNKSMLDIYIVPINTKVESLILAEKLRDLGFRIDIEMEDKKIRKSLDFANKEMIPYVVIYGEDEVNNEVFKLKDMFGNREYEIKYNEIDSIINIIKSIS